MPSAKSSPRQAAANFAPDANMRPRRSQNMRPAQSCDPVKVDDSINASAAIHVAMIASHGHATALTIFAKSSLKIAATASTTNGLSCQKYCSGVPRNADSASDVAAAMPSDVSGRYDSKRRSPSYAGQQLDRRNEQQRSHMPLARAVPAQRIAIDGCSRATLQTNASSPTRMPHHQVTR